MSVSEPSQNQRIRVSDSEDSNDSSTGLRSDDLETSDDEQDPDLLVFDPTPWHNDYPQPKWFSCKQFIAREYGLNLKPDLMKRKPNLMQYSPYWFRKYAYNSLYFIQKMLTDNILEDHTGCVNTLNFNSTGSLLCSGGDDVQIRIWDWETPEVKQSCPSGHRENIFCCRWCHNNTHIITSARDGDVRICDVNNSTSSRLLIRHTSPSHKLAFSDPNVVLSSGEDAKVYEIDLRTNLPTCLMCLRIPGSRRRIPIYSITCNMSFNPHYFAVAGQSSFVRIYDRRLLREPATEIVPPVEEDRIERGPNPVPLMKIAPPHLKESIHHVTCAVYNSTGSKILISYHDEDLYVLSTQSGAMEGKYQGHRNLDTIKSCAWFSDDYVLSGSDDGYIYGWERESQHIVMSIHADGTGSVNCIEMHPINPIIAASGIEDTIKVYAPLSNIWPESLRGIKMRICANMQERTDETRRFRWRTSDGEQLIWFVLNRRNDSDSESGGSDIEYGRVLEAEARVVAENELEDEGEG